MVLEAEDVCERVEGDSLGGVGDARGGAAGIAFGEQAIYFVNDWTADQQGTGSISYVDLQQYDLAIVDDHQLAVTTQGRKRKDPETLFVIWSPAVHHLMTILLVIRASYPAATSLQVRKNIVAAVKSIKEQLHLSRGGMLNSFEGELLKTIKNLSKLSYQVYLYPDIPEDKLNPHRFWCQVPAEEKILVEEDHY